MNSGRGSDENSITNSIHDAFDYAIHPVKLVQNTRPVFYAHIRKFKELISSAHASTSNRGEDCAEEINIQTKIIVQIIHRCFDDIGRHTNSVTAYLQLRMSPLMEPIKQLSGVFQHDMEGFIGDDYLWAKKVKLLSQIIQMKNDHINDISDEINRKKLEQSMFTTDKMCHIRRILDKICMARVNLKEEIRLLIAHYEDMKKKRLDLTASRVTTMNHSYKDVLMELRKTLRDHKLEENTLKFRTQKLDLQLAQWIEKYDNDIGRREYELQQLTLMYRNASNAFVVLDTTMKKHEVLYNQCVVERTTEEKRIFDMKLRALVCARAAKTLQRAWRAHRAKQKRKKRKGGKRSKPK